MEFSMFIKAFIITLIIYIPIMLLFIKKGKFVSKSDKQFEEATKQGRVVMGRLIKTENRWTTRPDYPSEDISQIETLGLYKYTVNGTNYQVWQSYYDTDPPKIQSFYYLPGKPEKAISTSVYKPSGCQIALIVLSMVILGIVCSIIQILN